MWPWLLAGAAGLAVTAAHLFSWRRLRRTPLPTSRFVPVGAISRARRRFFPDDVALWALRLLVCAALAAAVAGVPLRPWLQGPARIILVDATHAVASMDERRDSVAALLGGARHAELIAFDSVPRVVATNDVEALGRAEVPGSLDAALVVAARRAAALRAQYRQVEILVVSPVTTAVWSEAIPAIAEASGVAVRFSRLEASAITEGSMEPGSAPDANSVVGAAARLVMDAAFPGVRVLVGPASSLDSAFAAAGGLVVSFPETEDGARVRAVLAGEAVAVGPWGMSALQGGIPVAWWDDGTTAAVQSPHGRGCFRSVGVRLPSRGDEVLRPNLAAVMQTLLQPCRPSVGRPVPAAALEGVARDDSGIPSESSRGSRRLLLALAFAALVAEWFVRRARAARSA
jgi:hypothetical protein